MKTKADTTKRTIIEELKGNNSFKSLVDMYNLNFDEIGFIQSTESKKDYAILINVGTNREVRYTVNYNHQKINNDVVRNQRLKMIKAAAIY